MLNKIINFFKKKNISPTILVICVLVILLFLSLFLFIIIKGNYNVKTYKEKENFYYYFSSQKIDFEGTLTKDSNKNIIKISNNNLMFDSTPIYYKNKKQLLLPKLMEVVVPYEPSPLYRLNEFSILTYNGKYVSLGNKKSNNINNSFLFDGENTYIFIESTSIYVDNVRYDLSPMSYVRLYDYSIDIYNYEKNEFNNIKFSNKLIKGYTENYEINLTSGSFTYDNKYFLLMKSIKYLKEFEY